MTKLELRQLYEDKNPFLKGKQDGSITFTRKNFWKFYETTFDQAHTQGVLNGRAAEKMDQEKIRKTSKGLGDLFNHPPW